MLETVNHKAEKRGTCKERAGDEISNKMAKTIVVRVERRFPPREPKKVVTAFTQVYGHEEKAEEKVGDGVGI